MKKAIQLGILVAALIVGAYLLHDHARNMAYAAALGLQGPAWVEEASICMDGSVAFVVKGKGGAEVLCRLEGTVTFVGLENASETVRIRHLYWNGPDAENGGEKIQPAGEKEKALLALLRSAASGKYFQKREYISVADQMKATQAAVAVLSARN